MNNSHFKYNFSVIQQKISFFYDFKALYDFPNTLSHTHSTNKLHRKENRPVL